MNSTFFFILSNMLSLPVNTLAFGDMTELMAYLLSACVCVRMCVNCAPLKFWSPPTSLWLYIVLNSSIYPTLIPWLKLA